MLDVRGVPCPKPVVMAMTALKELKNGKKLEVLTDDPEAVQNLTRMAENKGYPVASVKSGSEWTVTITKAEGDEEPEAEHKEKHAKPPKGGYTVVIGTDRMGSGDDKLGSVLIKSYIYSLTQLEEQPETLIFFNGGAHLTTEGSDSLDDLKALEDMNVDIYTCGTCLDFLGIKEKLEVGKVTNMYEIAEKMASAVRLVRI